ncbi:MAG: molecular chaperone HtpG [Eggerthellaceae bacterium]|jgi:molecular chaperone HtpG
MRKFKTESKRLLDLMINSIYTNREIFLRELISNASDAVDKLYFKSLTDSSIEISKEDMAIHVGFDKEARTITVSDTGIGMTRDELEKNLGTIAHSGSLEFKDSHAEEITDASEIIGQFGVGFYSSFMVAKKVTVITRPYGSDEAFQWQSDGIEGYTIKEAERTSHGTDVILTLKDNTDEADYDEFLSEYALRRLIKQYSNYVRYPIQMEVTKQREKPRPEDAGDDYKPEYESYTETETINSMVPIWKRKKSEVSQEEYNEFYKQNFHDFADPICTTTIHAEGALNYDALLFIPGMRPFDLYSKDYEKGLALYSSNVLIMEKCADLLPDYYNFVHGIVDSPDLSLNISRETLQHNNQVVAIARRVEKKITSELENMRDKDRETYEDFFKNFGRGLKFGIYSTYGMNKDELGPLLLFYSAREEKQITLDEYIEKMSPDQESIYYAAGSIQTQLAQMPVVKTALNKGFDVLLCTEDVDEFCFQSMQGGYKDHALKNVANEDLDIATEEEKKEAETATEENKDLFEAMKGVLGDKVVRVCASSRLSDEPACVTAEGPVSLEMEQVLAQGPDGDKIKSDRVLEINPKHEVFNKLQQSFKENDDEKVALYTELLYDEALLVGGMPIEDPARFAANICKLM